MADLAAPSDDGRIEHRLRRDLHATDELFPSPPITADLVAETRRLGVVLRAHRRAGTVLIVVVALVAVAAILASPALGRAEPTSSYRPDLPPDPIALGCFPLPRGLTLDFPYQVVAVLLKVALLALLTQPFVHLSGSRYWTTAGALGGLAVAVLVRTAYDVVRPRPPEEGDEPARLLTALQWGLSGATVATVATVAVLAA